MEEVKKQKEKKRQLSIRWADLVRASPCSTLWRWRRADDRAVTQASELLVGVGLIFLYWAAVIQTQESIKPH